VSAENPFRIGEHVTGDHFTDREAEVDRIPVAMLQASSLLVYGRRRMGKSSAIRIAADEARARRPGVIVVHVDVSTVTSLFDISARLLRSLYEQTRSLRIRLEEIFGGLGPRVTITPDESGGVPSISFGIERRTADDEEKRRTLEAVFGRLLSVRERLDRPVAVVLDEFQAIHGLGGPSAEWHLREWCSRRTR